MRGSRGPWLCFKQEASLLSRFWSNATLYFVALSNTSVWELNGDYELLGGRPAAGQTSLDYRYLCS